MFVSPDPTDPRKYPHPENFYSYFVLKIIFLLRLFRLKIIVFDVLLFYIQPNQMRRHWTRTLANQSFVSFYKNRPRLQFYWLISLAQSLRHGIHFLLSFLTKMIDISAAKALNWQMHLSPFELLKICPKLGSHTPRRPQNYINILF